MGSLSDGAGLTAIDVQCISSRLVTHTYAF